MGSGKFDEKVSTSYVERLNLNTRQNCRRFTRLTNGFSKKAENHAHAVSLYFMHYNFCRVHATLTKANGGVHTTPAMAAGVTDRVWKVEDMLALMEPDTPLGRKTRSGKGRERNAANWPTTRVASRVNPRHICRQQYTMRSRTCQ